MVKLFLHKIKFFVSFFFQTYRFRSNLYQHKCPSRDRACELNGSRKSSSQKSPSKRKPTSSSSTTSPSTYCAYADDGSSTSGKKNSPKKLSNNSLSSSNGGATNATTTSANSTASVDATFNNKLQNWDVISDGGSYVSPTGSPQKFSPSPTNEEIQQFLDRHKDQLHKCPQCKMLFPSREYLTRHMSWHDVEESKVKCTFCSELFDNDQQYGLHKQSHVPHSVHICFKCKGKFCHRLALKKHLAKCRSGRFWPTTPTPQNGAYNPALFIDRTPPSTPASESSPPTEENDVGSIDSVGSVGEHQIISYVDNDHQRQQQEPSSMITVDLNDDYVDGKNNVPTPFVVGGGADTSRNFVETVTVCNNFNSSVMNCDEIKTTTNVDSSFNYMSYGASSSYPFVENTSSFVAYPVSSTADVAGDYFTHISAQTSSSSLPLTNSYSSSSYYVRDESSPFVQPSSILPYPNYHFGLAADVNSSGSYQFSAQTSSFYIPHDSNVVAGRSWTPDSDSNDNWLLTQTNRYAQPLSATDDVSSSVATVAPCVVDYWRPELDNSKDKLIRMHDGFDTIYPGNAEICGPLRADTPSIAALVEQRSAVSAIMPTANDVSAVSYENTTTTTTTNVANVLPIESDIVVADDLDGFFPETILREELLFDDESICLDSMIPKVASSVSPVFNVGEQQKASPDADGSEQYQCDSCDRLYQTSKGLHGHFLKIHVFNGIKRSYCVRRGKYRKNPFGFPSNETYSCGVCFCRFDSETMLAAHHLSEHRSESDGYRFTCETCSKSFRRKEHLQKHERTHLERQDNTSAASSTTTTMIENSNVHQRNCFENSVDSEKTVPNTPLNEDNLAAAAISSSPLRRSSRQKLMKTVDSMKVFQTKPNSSIAVPDGMMVPSCLMIVPTKKYPKADDTAIPMSTRAKPRINRNNNSESSSLLSDVVVDDQCQQQQMKEPFRCTYCQKSFQYKRYVKKHERLQHEIPVERRGESSSLVYSLKNKETYKLKCPFCVKRFTSPRLLKQHLAFHARANKLSI